MFGGIYSSKFIKLSHYQRTIPEEYGCNRPAANPNMLSVYVRVHWTNTPPCATTCQDVIGKGVHCRLYYCSYWRLVIISSNIISSLAEERFLFCATFLQTTKHYCYQDEMNNSYSTIPRVMTHLLTIISLSVSLSLCLSLYIYIYRHI